MFAPPFSGLQQILKAEQPFMAVQLKAGFLDSAIFESYGWHCRGSTVSIFSSYGCHLKLKIVVHSSKLWLASKKSLILRSSNFLPTLL
jgi:hypothetical protein